MDTVKISVDPAVFGPLAEYIENDHITDIDYNGKDLWLTTVENKRFKLENTRDIISVRFLEAFTGKIANEVSRCFHATETVLEAETETLRITIVHESVAISGRAFCIRKSLPQNRLTIRSVLEQEYCSPDILALLLNCVAARMNFVFCGEPSAGKTECAKFFSSFIPSNEKVITIEDNPEWHYKKINPLKDAIEFKVNPWMGYEKAIKTSLRLNPDWLMLSETRSVEARSLLTCWSTGIKGFTTLHTDDVRKIPDRLMNMMEASSDAERMIHDIYNYIDVGVLLRKKQFEDGSVRRYLDQACFYAREDGEDRIHLIMDQGSLIPFGLPDSVQRQFQRAGIQDFFEHPLVRRGGIDSV